MIHKYKNEIDILCIVKLCVESSTSEGRWMMDQLTMILLNFNAMSNLVDSLKTH